MRKLHILPDIILDNLFVKKKMHPSVIFTRIVGKVVEVIPSMPGEFLGGFSVSVKN